MTNLSNEDFKKLINSAASSQRIPQPITLISSHQSTQVNRLSKFKNLSKQKQNSKYRDRAEERRKGIELEDEQNDVESIEDVEDQKTRSDEEDEELERMYWQKNEKMKVETISESKPKSQEQLKFKTHVGRNLHRFLLESQNEKETPNDLFLPNRMQFIYSVRSKPDSEKSKHESHPAISIQLKSNKSENATNTSLKEDTKTRVEPSSDDSFDSSTLFALPRTKLQTLSKHQTRVQNEIRSRFSISEDLLHQIRNILQDLQDKKIGGDFGAYAKRKRKQIKKSQKLQELQQKQEEEKQKLERAKMLQDDGDNIFGDTSDDYVCQVELKPKQVKQHKETEKQEPEPSLPSLVISSEEQLLREKIERAKEQQRRIEEERKRQQFTRKDYETGYAAIFKNPNIKNDTLHQAEQRKKKKIQEEDVYNECYDPTQKLEYTEVEYNSEEDEDQIMRSSTLEATFKERADEIKQAVRGKGAGRGGRGAKQAQQEKKQKDQSKWQKMQHILKRKYGDDYVDTIQGEDEGESKKKKKKHNT